MNKKSLIFVILFLIAVSAISVSAIIPKDEVQDIRAPDCCEIQIYKDYNNGLINASERNLKIDQRWMNYSNTECCQLITNVSACEVCFETIKRPLFERDDIAGYSKAKPFDLKIYLESEDLLDISAILIPLLLLLIIADGVGKLIRKKPFLSKKIRRMITILTILLCLFFLLGMIGYIKVI